MKYLIKKLLALMLLPILLLQFSSCSKETFTKANINPNAPTLIVPNVILPSVEISLGYTQGGDLTRYAGLFMQQNVGFGRQSAAYYQYILTSTDLDNVWGNLYTSVLGNNKDLLTRSDAGGYNVYSGISRILMAYSLQLLVDGWGNVPYSDALKGDGNTHPAYDNDKALYDTIANLIDVGITQLNAPDPGALTPGTDDIIYGGDAAKWIKFGHAIKARLYIHQSKGNAAMAAQALTEANLAFTSNADNAFVTFGNSETAANPIYQFNSQRADIDYGAGYLPNLLDSLHDPRLTIYTDPNYQDVNQVGVGDLFGSIGAAVQFINYDEILFIKAEATLRTTGNVATAQGFYQDGIRASMEKLGVPASDIATYITANGILPANTNAAITQVAIQEYISLYLNPEAWTLWRRTGAPGLTPIAGTLGIPRRYIYPTNELSLNGANVPKSTLFSPKIFWDN
jgi:hypothetical protein